MSSEAIIASALAGVKVLIANARPDVNSDGKAWKEVKRDAA